jgi:hypothetical protein
LNLKDGMKMQVIGKPTGVTMDDVTSTQTATSDGVLVFVRSLSEVDSKCGPLVEAARNDRLAWVAYPKAGQMGTRPESRRALEAPAEAGHPRRSTDRDR